MANNAPDLSTGIWRKSTYSNGDGGNCVEVCDAHTAVVPVRDSKAPRRGLGSGPRTLGAGLATRTGLLRRPPGGDLGRRLGLRLRFGRLDRTGRCRGSLHLGRSRPRALRLR